MNRATYVLCYDVCDDDRRERLGRFLESVGRRVQRSVFEVLLTPGELAEVLRQAADPARLDAAVDSLRCYPVCGQCLGRARVLGPGAPPAQAGRPLVL